MASLGEFLAPGLYRKPEDQPWFVRMLQQNMQAAQAKMAPQPVNNDRTGVIQRPKSKVVSPDQFGADMTGLGNFGVPPMMGGAQPQNFSRDMGVAAPQPVMAAQAPPPMPVPALPSGSLGQPRMPPPAPMPLQVSEPVMQEGLMPRVDDPPAPNMPPPSLMQRLAGGMGERLLPAQQLIAMGMTPEQAAAAQTAAVRKFGLGMLSNIGTGEGFGAGIARGVKMAGPDQLDQLQSAGLYKAQIERMQNATRNRPMVTGPDGNLYYADGAKEPVLPGVTGARNEPKAPTSRTVERGNRTVTEEWDAQRGEWKVVGEAQRWKPGESSGAGQFSTASHDGINPQTGKPDKFVLDKNGNPKWLGITPSLAARQKTLPANVVQRMIDAGSTAQDFSRLKGSFQDSYGGYGIAAAGEVANALKRNLTSDSTGQGQFWQDYQSQKNVIRNRLFGSALTATEKAEFDKAMINPGMTPGTIRSNLARQEAIALRAARKLAKVYERGGYDPAQIEEALGMSLAEVEDGSGIPQAGQAPAAAPAPGGWGRATVKRP